MERPRQPWAILLSVMVWGFLSLGTLWAFGALWHDLPLYSGRRLISVGYLLAAIALPLIFRRSRRAKLAIAAMIFLVAGWWFSLRPSQNRDWKPEVAVLPFASVSGEVVTVSNIRNFDYRSQDDFDVAYEMRTYDLSQLRGVDIFITYWGPKFMAHPILSFDFGSQGRLCFSIETRPEKGEGFSAIGGFYRRFELICIAANERDVVRVRTNYRTREKVYLYRLRSTPEQARETFLEYIATINGLAGEPRWYNAITDNCTTAIRNQQAAADRLPWDWRLLINGYGDRMLYDQGSIDQSLPFEELKRRSLINDKARLADQDPNFSARIREGLPGF